MILEIFQGRKTMECCFKILLLAFFPHLFLTQNQFVTAWKIFSNIKQGVHAQLCWADSQKNKRITYASKILNFFACKTWETSLCSKNAPRLYNPSVLLTLTQAQAHCSNSDFGLYESWAACQTKWKAPFDNEIKPCSPLPFRWARWMRRFTLSESDAAWMVLKSHSSSRKLWNLDRCDSVKLFFNPDLQWRQNLKINRTIPTVSEEVQTWHLYKSAAGVYLTQ